MDREACLDPTVPAVTVALVVTTVPEAPTETRVSLASQEGEVKWVGRALKVPWDRKVISMVSEFNPTARATRSIDMTIFEVE